MNRKSLTITFLILLSAFAYAADLPDPSEYSKADGSVPPLVFMEDFSGGLDSWEHSPAVGIDRHGGMNGTAALCLQRTREQKGRYQDAIVTLKADACVLKKGKTYVFRGYYRTEDVPEDTRIQTTPSVTTITRGYSAEHYPQSYPKPSKEWKKVEIKFIAPSWIPICSTFVNGSSNTQYTILEDAASSVKINKTRAET